MGLLEIEIRELRSILKDFLEGRVSAEKVGVCLNVYARTEKRASLILQAHSGMAKYGKSYAKQVEKSQLFGGGGSVLGLVEKEQEQVFCDEQKKLITRRHCLDYSGKNQDGCCGCENFASSRKIILGENDEVRP